MFLIKIYLINMKNNTFSCNKYIRVSQSPYGKKSNARKHITSTIFCPNFKGLFKWIKLEAFVNFKMIFYHVKFIYSMLFAYVCGTEGHTLHRNRVCCHTEHMAHSVLRRTLENTTEFTILVCICSTQTAVQLRATNAANMKAQWAKNKKKAPNLERSKKWSLKGDTAHRVTCRQP